MRMSRQQTLAGNSFHGDTLEVIMMKYTHSTFFSSNASRCDSRPSHGDKIRIGDVNGQIGLEEKFRQTIGRFIERLQTAYDSAVTPSSKIWPLAAPSLGTSFHIVALGEYPVRPRPTEANGSCNYIQVETWSSAAEKGRARCGPLQRTASA